MLGRIVSVLRRLISWGRARTARRSLTCVLALSLVAGGCARRSTPPLSTPPVPHPAPKSAVIGSTETGVASWYGVPYHGRRSASGEIFDMEKLTAAHRDLPFQTWVEVTNLSNGKQVDVRITDRGPFVRGRIIDVSMAAARELDMVRAGVVKVRLKVIVPPANPLGIPQTSANGYAVQAGAFSDPSRAEAFRESLPYADTRVVERPVLNTGNPSLWRVLVGRALTIQEATALAASVEKVAGQMVLIIEDAQQ